MKFAILAFSLVLCTPSTLLDSYLLQEEDSLTRPYLKYGLLYQEKPILEPIIEEVEPIEEEIDKPKYREVTVVATAYTAYCKGCSGTTKTGQDLRKNPHLKVIAVDPSIIPLGSKVWVEGYGEAIAGDIGGAIKGHKIDVFIPKTKDALEWGRQKITIKVYN